MAVPEWLATATVTKNKEGIGGTITPNEEFAELFRNISTELLRVGKTLRKRKDLTRSKVVMAYNMNLTKVRSEGVEAASTPILATMKHIPIPNTDFHAGERSTLLSWSERNECFVAENVPYGRKFDTKEQLESLLTGLRSL